MERNDAPVVGHQLAGEEAGGDLEGVLEQVEELAGRRERDSELGVLLVVPRGAERQLEPPPGGVVDGEHLGGEHRGVPVGHPGDEAACASGSMLLSSGCLGTSW